jgi:hypothetical protein
MRHVLYNKHDANLTCNSAIIVCLSSRVVGVLSKYMYAVVLTVLDGAHYLCLRTLGVCQSSVCANTHTLAHIRSHVDACVRVCVRKTNQLSHPPSAKI